MKNEWENCSARINGLGPVWMRADTTTPTPTGVTVASRFTRYSGCPTLGSFGFGETDNLDVTVGSTISHMSSHDKTVEERALEHLESTDDWQRASSVAEAIDSETNYTRQVLNGLNKDEEVEKDENGDIIGTTINSELYVISNRGVAEIVVRAHGGLSDSEMASMTLKELRDYIRQNLADWSGPINQKVWYRRN